MVDLALAAVRFLGIPGLIVVGGLIFYEGLPLGPLRWIPGLGPVLAEFVDGRVDREREQAVEAIRAESRAAAMAMIQQRSEDNEEISTLDQAQLCAELGGKWIDREARCD
jgi:hypothetical protein